MEPYDRQTHNKQTHDNRTQDKRTQDKRTYRTHSTHRDSLTPSPSQTPSPKKKSRVDDFGGGLRSEEEVRKDLSALSQELRVIRENDRKARGEPEGTCIFSLQ